MLSGLNDSDLVSMQVTDLAARRRAIDSVSLSLSFDAQSHITNELLVKIMSAKNVFSICNWIGSCAGTWEEFIYCNICWQVYQCLHSTFILVQRIVHDVENELWKCMSHYLVVVCWILPTYKLSFHAPGFDRVGVMAATGPLLTWHYSDFTVVSGLSTVFNSIHELAARSGVAVACITLPVVNLTTKVRGSNNLRILILVSSWWSNAPFTLYQLAQAWSMPGLAPWPNFSQANFFSVNAGQTLLEPKFNVGYACTLSICLTKLDVQ